MFVTGFTKARFWILVLTSSMQFTSSQMISPNLIIISSSQIRIGIPNELLRLLPLGHSPIHSQRSSQEVHRKPHGKYAMICIMLNWSQKNGCLAGISSWKSDLYEFIDVISWDKRQYRLNFHCPRLYSDTVCPHRCYLNPTVLASGNLEVQLDRDMFWGHQHEPTIIISVGGHFTCVWSRLGGILLACGEAIAGVPGDRWTHGRCDRRRWDIMIGDTCTLVGIMNNWLSSARSPLLYQFIRREIKLTEVTIEAYHCYQLHAKFYTISLSQSYLNK
jgi:hypothetical protein